MLANDANPAKLSPRHSVIITVLSALMTGERVFTEHDSSLNI